MPANADETEEVRRLLHDHIPEVASGVVEIMGIARVRGSRVMVTVRSKDERIDPVAACVGERGSRVKTVVRHLPGEKVDIVRWSDSLKTLLVNLFAPARIEDILIQETAHRVVIFTNFDNKQLILGTDALRTKLVSRLVGWDLQVETG